MTRHRDVLLILVIWAICFFELVNSRPAQATVKPNLIPISTHCRDNLHVHGRWVYNPNVNMVKAFPCCGYHIGHASWVNSDWEWNKSICLDDRAQHHTYFFGMPPPRQSLVGGSGCVCDASSPLGRFGVNRRERYEWTPHYCAIERFEGKKFCSIMGKRSIVFIGDSTMQQQAITLMDHITGTGGDCAPRVGMLMNVELVSATGNIFKMDWVDMMRTYAASIVVLSMGPHFHNVSHYYSVWEDVARHFRENQVDKYVKENRVTVLVRTTNPGHINCSRNATIPTSVPLIEPDAPANKYNWDLFPIFDDIAKLYARLLGWKVVDVSPLYRRSDAHPGSEYGDCLHFCIPGPLNLFNQLLQTMLESGEIVLP
jgi:hypothetical protein